MRMNKPGEWIEMWRGDVIRLDAGKMTLVLKCDDRGRLEIFERNANGLCILPLGGVNCVALKPR